MKRYLFALIFSARFLDSQVPTPKVQPTTATYGVDALQLLPEYSRASFQSTFGVPAPPYDPTRRPKTWFDSTQKCDGSSVTYKSLSTGDIANVTFVDFSMSSCEASKVNLKGATQYPKYVLPFSSSNVSGKCGAPGCQASTLGTGMQATRAMAQAMLAEIGDPALSITDLVPSPSGCGYCYSKINPSSDVSIYRIGAMNVNAFWTSRNLQGAGIPGKWSKTAPGLYLFTPAAVNDGSADTRGNVPLPLRQLFANEKFTVQMLGIVAQTVITRTDLTPAPTQMSGGSFTPADRTLIEEIHRALLGN